MYVSFFFEDSSAPRAVIQAKSESDTNLDNTLVGRVISAMGLPARISNVFMVPMLLRLRSGELPPQLHVILAQILRYQTERKSKKDLG